MMDAGNALLGSASCTALLSLVFFAACNRDKQHNGRWGRVSFVVLTFFLGLALMLAGIVGSLVYGRTQKLTLRPGVPGKALGYRIVYPGSERPVDTRREMKLSFTNERTHFTATIHMIYNQKTHAWVHSTSVKKFWLQNIYVSPVGLREGTSQAMSEMDLKRGGAVKLKGYTFSFDKFDMGGHAAKGMSVGAVLRVKGPNGKTATIKPATLFKAGGMREPQPVGIPGTAIQVALLRIMVPTIHLGISGLPGAASTFSNEMLDVEVSSKPLTNVIWLGTVLVLLGGALAVIRRARQSRRSQLAAAQPALPAVNADRKIREKQGVR